MNAPFVTKIKNQRSAAANSPSEVRIAYPYLHEKRTKNAAGILYTKKDGTPNARYSGILMFPKLNADPNKCPNYTFLLGLAYEAAQKMWPQNVDATGKWVWPQGAQYGVKDGDVPYASKPKPGVPVPTAEEIAKKNAWRVGYWIVEAENFLDDGPAIAKVVNGQVLDVKAKVINGIAQYKSGDWGYPCLHAWAYQNETFGVNFGFDGFCFTREGELIGSTGPKSATQMFGALGATVGAGMPAAGPAGAPTPGALPGAAPAPGLPPLPGAAPAPSLAPGLPPLGVVGGPLPGLPPIPGR